ncbi:hypothetical protein C0216_16760 [Streptomyces globosus]|uniref:Uncharacterized protein n=1 Tax=Streptomyces globosus TaxID=68209 RepID=A0A344U1W2_9ACTN|nr:hypothetical protein [Streptomyces globosus]AXE24883.1 hypothetical protein C0216_16760 [Streptomyces globosus]
MSTSPKSHVPHGEGPGRHKGTEQHGWSGDVDATHEQDNPSARRSFDSPDKRRKGGSKGGPPDTGSPVESRTRRGEDMAGQNPEGHHDEGRRGRSGRPSGAKDDSAFSGVRSPDAPKTRRKG